MPEHAGALLADQNFGGAQGDVGWINCRRSRSTRRHPGVPLAHQRGRASVRLVNQHTGPGRGAQARTTLAG